MFSRFTRLPLRRCLHTAAPRATSSRLRFTVGASAAVAATYLTWQLTSDSNRIALDSAPKVPPVKQPIVSPSSPPLSSTNLGSETSFVADPVHKESGAEFPPEDKPVDTDTLEKPAEDSVKTAEGDESPDAGTGGAFNPVTGEINWDCPCLGGMAHGPCGPEFREAFSCFVFSEEEPKGINCVEKFKGMQTCFREHPEIYGDEIMDDDDDEQPAAVPEGAVLTSSDNTVPTKQGDITSQDIPSSRPEKTVQKEPRIDKDPSPASATS